MISVIIPAYNEEAQIQATIQGLRAGDKDNLIQEVIVADGGSTDTTADIARAEGVQVISSPQKGRAVQMNYGASAATGKILYFLHADTIPPKNFTTDIANAYTEAHGAGCFMLSFNYNHWFLKANCWLTRFDIDAVRFGDQSLFVTREDFIKAGGFSEELIIMEDQHFIKRLKGITSFTVIKKPVKTSARTYLQNGIYKTQFIFFMIYFMYTLGYSQQKLVAAHRKFIMHGRL